MGARVTLAVWVQLSSGVWTDITTDTQAVDGLNISYGITSNGPLDSVAGTGEASFTLKNHAGNSGAQQGYYSPNHASKRTGWTFGIPCLIAFTDVETDASKSVSSITRSGTTATVTTAAAHGYTSNDWVTIAGAGQAEYNGVFQATVTGGSTFTYTVGGTPATPATGTLTARKAYVKHRGKVRVIDPDTGQYGTQLCHVVSYDGMRDLVEADVRSVTLQTDKTEAQLITTILDSLDANTQPVARDFDAGVDTFPYAFDNLGGGRKALGVIKDIADSSFALVAMKGDGTLLLVNRHGRVTGSSLHTFANTMHGLTVPSSLDPVYNLVRVTIHPKTVSAAATEELYALPTGTNIEIAAGATQEVWTDYSDPNDRETRIGGTAIVTALVGGTHYSANSAADGTGSDLTANITAAIDPFASTAKWTLTNGASVTAYIRPPFKVIGKAVRDPGAQTYQSFSTQSYGVRPLSIDMPYQDDALVAQGAADFVEGQRNSLANQLDAIEFIANDSSAFMTRALAREPGDRITITEAVSGLTLVDATIQSVSLRVTPGPWVVCRWGLAPASPWAFFQWGTVGAAEWGQTTVWGF